jgi:hypothetical protein
MEPKKFFYWVEGDMGESDKNYFATPESFLEFLRNNDPTLCGAEEMTQSEFDKLPADVEELIQRNQGSPEINPEH